jgi:ribosomal protein S27E
MSTNVNCPHCGKGLELIRVPGGGLTKPTADASTRPEPKADADVDPQKLVKCDRCGEEGLAWAKSKKGKFYLRRIETDATTGLIYARRKEFHSCQ